MASKPQKVTNISSGIYFREIDLTIATQAAGTFAGGAIVLSEKGPAFELLTSTLFDERRLRMGDLNPKYPSSYFAREFLAQAANYKEVRVLGLEGYSEEVAASNPDATGRSFVVMYNFPTAVPQAATPTTPVIATPGAIAAVLKPRRRDITGRSADVIKVEVNATLQADGITTAATDDLFQVVVTFSDTTTVTAIASLRPERKEYVSKVFGEDPRDKTLLQGLPSPIWIEFILPSVKQKRSATGNLAYYYPGDTGNTPHNDFLQLVTGDGTINLGFTYPSTAVSNVTAAGTVIIDFGVAHSFIVGQIVTVTGIAGSGNLTNVNTNWKVFAIGGTTIQISDIATNNPAVGITGTYSSGGSVRLFYEPTWEAEVMNLGGVVSPLPFQTPITPWFVSDADINGEVKRLFRFFSISDGEVANTEIKIEIRNIDPTGNLGKGSFDVLVRSFDDKEDGKIVVLEGFPGCTMDPTSDNWIKRKIGDGDDFQLASKYILVEMNDGEEIPDDALPYGVEGYPNVTGVNMPDLVWTTQYNFSKSLSKQSLGLASNSTNMFAPVTRDNLSFKNVQDLTIGSGLGFHLNPLNNPGINTGLYTVIDQTIYQVNPPTNTGAITPSEKVKRSRYVVSFFGGSDGFNVYSERKWNDQTSADYQALATAIDLFNDPENLLADFSVLVTPDINFNDHPSACDAVSEMVKSRGDALYIPDFKYNFSDSDPEDAALELTSGNGSGLHDNHIAIYMPYVQIEDTVNKINAWMPPSLIALATIASTATNEQVWQPPAGPLRTVTDNLVRTRRRMKLPDREVLKKANINPITLFPGSGFEITETRTTQEFFSALSFVHNRLLLGYAKKALNQTLRPLLHQLNGDITKNAFINTVTPIFDRIKKLNGLEEFKVVVLSQSDDRTTLNGQVEIVPLYPVERIIVDFVLTNSGVSFNA